MNKTTFAVPAYKPGPVPEDPKEIRRYLDEEFNRIAATMQNMAIFRLPPSAAPPERPLPNQLVYTLGTTWDPGSGEGYYYYNSHGVWTPLG